jgi:hypothetical protein
MNLLAREIFAVPSKEVPAIVLAVCRAVAVAAFPVVLPELPVTLPAIGAVTVSPVRVPTEVIAGWAAAVTVAALPVVFWFNIGKSPATAIVNAPVVVVLFRIPVVRAEVPRE